MSAVLPTSSQPARRRLVLGLALAASVGASLWAAFSDEQADQAAPVTGTPRKLIAAASPGAGAARSPIGWPQPLKPDVRDAWPAADPQARLAWGMEAVPAPPALKAPPPPPAPPPQAPPLGYQLVGRMDDESAGGTGKPRAIFSNELRTEVLGAGEVLDRQWRIESIGPQGVQLAWLRGDQKKTLTYSSSPPSP